MIVLCLVGMMIMEGKGGSGSITTNSHTQYSRYTIYAEPSTQQHYMTMVCTISLRGKKTFLSCQGPTTNQSELKGFSQNAKSSQPIDRQFL